MASALPATAPSRSARRGEAQDDRRRGNRSWRRKTSLSSTSCCFLRGQGRRGAADATGGPGRPSEGSQRLRRVPVDLTRPRICSQGSTCPGTQRLIWRAPSQLTPCRNFQRSSGRFPAGRQRPSRVEDALRQAPRGTAAICAQADGCNRQSQGAECDRCTSAHGSESSGVTVDGVYGVDASRLNFSVTFVAVTVCPLERRSRHDKHGRNPRRPHFAPSSSALNASTKRSRR